MYNFESENINKTIDIIKKNRLVANSDKTLLKAQAEFKITNLFAARTIVELLIL